jgi:hypothetical protein
MACYEGPDGSLGVGVCKAGTRACFNGVYTPCLGQVLPMVQTCDGLDDDCNGLIDDIVVDAGILGNYKGELWTCHTGQLGVCDYGTYQCTDGGNGDGGVGCVALNAPMLETCSGMDLNCNGVIDDGVDGGGCAIPNVLGECAKGQNLCVDAGFVCTQVNFPTSHQTCNGKDSACNGHPGVPTVVDGGPDGGVALCPVGQVCSCAANTTCKTAQCVATCPFVFSFDGDRYLYETSIGGAALFGNKTHLTKEPKKIDFAPLWVRLDRARVDFAGGAGSLSTKVLAAEDEIVYYDDTSLMVVEHAPGYEVLSSSSIQWNILARPDPGELYAVRTQGLRPPERASWMQKVDVTAALATLDDVAVAHDLAVANYYDLDFGSIVDAAHARLVIEGWKVKRLRGLGADVKIEPPRLEVRQPDGSWKKALALSTPRGDRKAIAFDLSAVAWPTGRYEMRLFTGTHESGQAMWYLDRVRLMEEPTVPVAAQEILASRATLRFVGPPSVEDEKNNAHPVLATDDGRGALLPEERTWGRFTRYGDVRDLLRAPDDRMVVMRRGDGIELAFDGIPRPAPGRVHTYFLRADVVFKPRRCVGCERAMPITDHVEPMPFHGMGHYPYAAPKHFPDDEAHRRYLDEYNTREYREGDPRWGE